MAVAFCVPPFICLEINASKHWPRVQSSTPAGKATRARLPVSAAALARSHKYLATRSRNRVNTQETPTRMVPKAGIESFRGYPTRGNLTRPALRSSPAASRTPSRPCGASRSRPLGTRSNRRRGVVFRAVLL
jgi:hypothetical protein